MVAMSHGLTRICPGRRRLTAPGKANPTASAFAIAKASPRSLSNSYKDGIIYKAEEKAKAIIQNKPRAWFRLGLGLWVWLVFATQTNSQKH